MNEREKQPNERDATNKSGTERQTEQQGSRSSQAGDRRNDEKDRNERQPK